MDHIAILNKKQASISEILSGRKSIESRWYKHKISPWNKVNIGDRIFFKESGRLVTAVAYVEKVLQFDNLNKAIFNEIIDLYADKICLKDRSFSEYYKEKRFVILMFLKNAQPVDKLFKINKSGFGSACAWISIENIKSIVNKFIK